MMCIPGTALAPVGDPDQDCGVLVHRPQTTTRVTLSSSRVYMAFPLMFRESSEEICTDKYVLADFAVCD